MTIHSLPRGQEARQGALVGGLDLAAQDRQRGPSQAPQHLGVAPLALGAAGSQLTADELAGTLELAQHRAGIHPVAVTQLGRGERAMCPGVTADQLRQRVGDLDQERVRQPPGRHRRQGVPVQARVLGRHPALLPGQPEADRAPLALELGQNRLSRDPLHHALGRLGGGQVAHPAQHLMQGVAVGGAGPCGAMLEIVLDRRERVEVDELAQLLLSEQLAQQIAIQGQGGGPALGVGSVALVHVGGDVVEEQRGGERRRRRRLHLDQRQFAAVERPEELLQAGEVEHVAQAFPVGLEDQRELPVAPGDLQERLGLQPLLPQRRASPGIRPRDEKRSGGVLAEAGSEQRRPAQLADHQVLQLVGLDHDQIGAGGIVGVG